MKEQAHEPKAFLVGVLSVFLLCAHGVSGARMAAPEARIIGGSATAEGDWPFMVLIYEKQNGKVNGFICGGSLISNQWVLTAAHCFRTNDKRLYAVSLGEYSRSVTSANEQDFDVSRLVLHQSYDRVAFRNDIALVKLSRPATINSYVSTVRLAAAAGCDAPAPNFPVGACLTLGWGKTTAAGSTSDTLRKVTSFIFPHALCLSLTLTNAAKYGNRPVGSCLLQFCGAYNNGEDTCEGDSGSPLVCRHSDNHYYVHGIVSYGTTVCGQNLPGVYTRVAGCRRWISNNMTP